MNVIDRGREFAQEQKDRERHYKALEETAHLRTYGYAPGGYLCKCTDENCTTVRDLGVRKLERTFDGDKRAWRCRPCAEKRHAEELDRRASAELIGKKEVRMPQLVRDKMIPRAGINEANELVPKPYTVALLIGKLHSEVAELSLDLTNPDEYGDVYEILLTLAKRHGVTLQQIVEAADAKRAIKGGFDTGNFWIPEDYINER